MSEHRPMRLDEGTRIRTDAKTIVAIVAGTVCVVGTYFSMHSEIATLRDMQTRQSEQLNGMEKDLKLVGSKVDRLIGYQSGISRDDSPVRMKLIPEAPERP